MELQQSKFNPSYVSPKEQLRRLNIYKTYLRKYYIDLPQPIRSWAYNHLLDVDNEIIRKKSEIEEYLKRKKESENLQRQMRLF